MCQLYFLKVNVNHRGIFSLTNDSSQSNKKKFALFVILLI